jgi:hypothetical protein
MNDKKTAVFGLYPSVARAANPLWSRTKVQER